MEESNEEHDIVPELYFLIAKFLAGGPLKETAKTLLKELDKVEVLPRRLDWLGGQHAQSYRELESRHSDISWRRLAAVCSRALQMARGGGGGGGLHARLSLLSEALVAPARPPPADQSLAVRLQRRELGRLADTAQSVFPRRMLCDLQLQRRTLGHLSAVYCLVFDPSGRYVITGADDLLVKVWSALDGRLVATLRGCGAEITDICVSGDGALLAAGSVERLVRVWCLATGAPRAVLHAHAGTITSVQWSPACRGAVRWLASTSTDGSVAFWTCSGDGHFLSQPVQYVERLRPGACHMICAAWSPGGALLAAGSADQHVRLYALQAAGPARVLEVAVHEDAVDSLAWAHRGLRFVSGSKDGSAALWTLHATQWRHTMLNPPELRQDHHKRLKVTMVAWDCSDALVLTAVSDWSVRVWCARSGRQLRALTGHSDEAYVLEAHPFLPGVLLSAGHDGQLFVWDAPAGEVLARFHNRIEGQGDGAIFDAKWGGGASIAATDSHGHLLLLGLGRGHRLLADLPTELFFHTDYRPLVRDALGGALDEQTQTPPHLMPPPFLVDVEGAPHPPHYQRLVPGRENLALAQLIPAPHAARSRIDLLIEALAAGGDGGEVAEEGLLGGVGGGGVRGVWRGEGVRHTLGSWQRGDPLLVPHSSRPLVQPLAPAHRQRLEEASAELNAMEQSWYRREMRRRPVMINTAPDGGGGPRRRPGWRARGRMPAARARPQAVRVLVEPPEVDSPSCSDTSDSSVRLSGAGPRSASSYDPTDVSSSHSGTKSDNSESSQYSDWEAGAALAPPARARRRPLPAKRYSPSATAKRSDRPGPSTADPGAAEPGCSTSATGTGRASVPSTSDAVLPLEEGPAEELPELYRVGEWLTAVVPRKAPYHPQMGDVCLYFRLGHQRYFEAVAEKDLYKVNPRDKPWERTQIQECELVKVVGIKYEIKPPRVACVRLARVGAGGGRSFTVRYHDMPDVIDFLVLHQQYETAVARRWGPGDRFRCMIDDSWWTGVVVERCPGTGAAGASAGSADSGAPGSEQWAASAAEHFLSLRVRWDNGEVERLSPWDLEPLDPDRLPSQAGGSVPVLPSELESVLYRAERGEWSGERGTACRSIAQHVARVMSLGVAEPFAAPVDLQAYPQYARVVPYPIDLATIKGRFDNLFYRRAAAAQFDVRYLATNAERFNEPHSIIVRQARLLTDLLLHIISEWRSVDVVAKYHELAAAYHSSDDEPLATTRNKGSGRAGRARRRAGGGDGAGEGARGRGEWRAQCAAVLRELTSSADAQPFMQPVSLDQAPDYNLVVERAMDLGTVGSRLARGDYSSPEHFAEDVRLVFSNSRLYNTNKRSRIYSMTVRLAALFEALWSRSPPRAPPPPRPRRRRHGRRSRPSHAPRTRPRPRTRHGTRAASEALMNGHSGGEGAGGAGWSDSSDCETLAAVGAAAAAAAAASRRARDDSWDSDAPLGAHRKGKGVGKKSKRGAGAVAGGSGTRGGAAGEGGAASTSGASSTFCQIEVLEEELLEDDVELMYDTASATAAHAAVDNHRRDPPQRSSRKRARSTSSDSSSGSGRDLPGRDRPLKRTRERFAAASSSSSESASEPCAGDESRCRYESDHSYRPRYSTDDDAPLHLYRQRQDGAGAGAGPVASTSGRHNGHTSRAGGSGARGVSLRARRSPRRYNEDSEEDSAAAITKRLQHHGKHQLAHRRRNHAAQSAELVAAHTADHNYFNGNAQPPPAPHHPLHPPPQAPVAPHHSDAHAGLGTSSGPAVSISSRGRVRKLTAKARGLLTE